MIDEKGFESEQLESSLQSVSKMVQAIAVSCRGDNLKLLAILRMLESLHQEIRDTLFQDSLPTNRQALYHLLKDIEASGGWPYIHRMRLQSLLKNFDTIFDQALAPTLSTMPQSKRFQEVQDAPEEES